MNLKLNYEYFLQSRRYRVVNNIDTELDVKRSKRRHGNKVSLEDLYLNRGRHNLNMPTLPIIEEETYVEEPVIIEEPIIQSDDKLVALTFDDGPSKYTNDIINILNNTNSKATFFISGDNIKNNEEVIKNISKNGNQIGVRGYSHVPFPNLDIDDVNAEIAITFDMLYNIGVKPSRIVRPPFGKLNETIKEQVRAPFVLWNIDTEDWKNQDKEIIKDKIRKNISEGSIILMHDIYPSTLEAVQEIIPEMQNNGYKFVTIEDMHHNYDVDLEPGKVYAKVRKNKV